MDEETSSQNTKGGSDPERDNFLEEENM